MTGIYTRGADLARDAVEYRQAFPALLSDAGELLDELAARHAREPEAAAAVLLCWLESAGSFGRIAESRAERARQGEARAADGNRGAA